MAPKSSQKARHAKRKAAITTPLTSPSLKSPFDWLDLLEESNEQVIDSAVRMMDNIPDGVAKKNLYMWMSHIRYVGCYTKHKTFAVVAAHIDFHMDNSPYILNGVMPSGEARRTFRMMPESQCKRFVRECSDQLQQDGMSVEDAMRAALMRSIKKFAETWRVILCGIEEGPWNVNDIEIALRSAELAVELSLPQVGNAVMLHEHGNAFLEALAGVDLALLEKSGRVCSFVEEMLRSTCAQKRAAATAVFYRSGSGAHVPRITLAKRLEHAINSEADEFIVFWHHEYKQFNFIEGQDMESFFETEKQRLLSQGLAEHDGKPWYRQARVGPYNLVVRYYLFGAEPHVNEPVSATLAGGSHLCATLVYAWCTRLDRASGQTKKRLLQAVSISAHCASLQASANTCSTCSASNAYLCAPVHRAPSMVAARPSGRDEQTDVDKEVERANEEARNRKLLTKRLAVQPSLAGPTLAAKEADGPGSSGPGVSSETNLSKSARRSQENKAKQRRAEKHRDEVKQQRADNEFRKVLEAVEPLRQESDTVVREDLESLESVKDLDALLQKAEKQAKAKPRRQLAEKEAELAHALLGTGQLRGRVHREVKDFIESFPGIAPDAQTFAERLVEALLGDEAIEFFDAHVAAELYGDFADAFVGRDWSERRLAHVGHRVILRAAALA